ncbi:uncharacterized protein A1O5_12705 [Cladophialophora psammophila CBS 110553]|uniref:Copper transport protein n=1 Tax=Cladophialophora psammophila CBS 110553 TaxID=1182543 RepID=W9WCK4_9EURO|nr:uncharacterized protein A1O5_12705 [Cladophialophora psammophila CBS 110553]EXJ56249.1 hypothetical protein A1O5_12705 [Cladophialophora psammophila CBS 110553]
MSMAAASSSASGMDMGGMGMGNTCKISMTWNWYTVGACFISDSWQITSGGMFAGSCIGVICLVISLEFLRRGQREYDGWLARKDKNMLAAYNARHDLDASSGSSVQNSNGKGPTGSALPAATPVSAPPRVDRMTLLQRQVLRSLLHAVQFGVAYFIMLLAMYYNGYIIICIIIGAFLGAFIFTWDQLLNEAK